VSHPVIVAALITAVGTILASAVTVVGSFVLFWHRSRTKNSAPIGPSAGPGGMKASSHSISRAANACLGFGILSWFALGPIASFASLVAAVLAYRETEVVLSDTTIGSRRESSSL
jgi:hypothetical protein